jgi:arylsulfatase A-like enzyme
VAKTDGPGAPPEAEAGAKPNILLIVSDEHGPMCSSAYGQSIARLQAGLDPALVGRRVPRTHFDRSLIALGHRARAAHPTSAG